MAEHLARCWNGKTEGSRTGDSTHASLRGRMVIRADMRVRTVNGIGRINTRMGAWFTRPLGAILVQSRDSWYVRRWKCKVGNYGPLEGS